MPYIFKAKISTGKDLCQIMLKIVNGLEEQKYSFQAILLIANGIRKNILANLDVFSLY